MTEAEARAEVERRVDADATAQIDRFLAMVASENQAQNLVSPATLPNLWSRHALDSIQLLGLAEDREGLWIDIGTGGGFPGLVVALARRAPMLLVEPRRRRAGFLADSARTLGLDHVRVEQAKVEAIGRHQAAIISARAVASVENLLRAAQACGTPSTRWLLPRGRIAPDELASLSGKGMFHVEQSVTDSGSSILVLEGVRA